jgi:hypothetical protein
VKVAGRRWTVEENFQAGKGLTGLDEHQVRRWTSWYRWVTLAMLAAAFLTIAAAREHAREPAPAGQIPLTRNEIAHLLATVILNPAGTSITGCAGLRGAGATSTAPRHATTSGKPVTREDGGQHASRVLGARVRALRRRARHTARGSPAPARRPAPGCRERRPSPAR